MRKKLVYVESKHSQIYDELAKLKIDKRLRIEDDGRVVTIETDDDWADDEITQLKGVVSKVHPDKKLSKEETT